MTVSTGSSALNASPRQELLPAPLARQALGGVAALVMGVLISLSDGYGYHRDELYFLRAGQKLAFGYVDQPPLTPLLARVASELFGDSLVGLRLASAVTAGLVVFFTGLLARELGGTRGAQVLAAACMAVSAILLAVGHLLSTSTFDLLAWTAVSWAVVRALRHGGYHWLLVGLLAGVGLQNKVLVVFLLAGLAAGLLLVGPRKVLRSRWPWLAAAVALALWAPYLLWQATHGWPQLELSSAIAAGSSGTSEPRWLFLPYQLVLISPLLVPVWGAGLWRLARDPALRTFRAFAVAYPLLAGVFLVTGGKPYYLAGLYPVLLAAGSDPALRWTGRGATWLRRVLLAGALAVSAAISTVLFRPLVPVQHLAATPVVDINYDAGETVGWTAFVHTIADIQAGLPTEDRTGVVVLTRNYGQAGAIDRYRTELGLPPAYSGHNSYAEWGPPPEDAQTVIVVGYDRESLQRWFGSVEPAARIDNGVGLDNDEQGTPVWICQERLTPWAQLWPQVRHLG
ncbi:UNVERIFIED_CONTAM: glycosyltransferase family 39 protein [Kocuria sp. CPCC 205316]|uniref:glycosyltransferase family 39 protein n=1 Tax=Kocuria TaxID=57493 RepID=UPI0036DA3459